MTDTILLTGATGFLGSHILKGLIHNTDYNVIVLKRSFSNISRIENFINNDRVKCFDTDNCDLERIFEENSIETVIHCATNYGKNHNSVYDVLDANLMFPVKLLDNSVKYGVKCFINTDSYFNKEHLSYPYLLNYSLSKKSLLLWLEYFSKQIKVINLRLEHIFGEDDNKDKFVASMIDNIAVNRVKSIDLTAGEQIRDFIYVDDVTDIYIKMLDYSKSHSFSFELIDVGTGIPTSIKEFVQSIKDISNSPTILNFGTLPYRENEIMYSTADLKTLEKFGLKPKYSYKDGLKKIIKENRICN